VSDDGTTAGTNSGDGAGDGPVAGPGTHVTLHFALLLPDGTRIDATPGDRPATFLWGDGRLPVGFERRLAGLRAGERGRFDVPAAEAFGPHHPHNVQTHPRGAFPEHLGLEPGLVVHFQDPRGGGIPGIVRSVTDDHVEVDFNHPLAGRDLVFEVHLVAVAEAPAPAPDPPTAEDEPPP
jgi:FKBP-type peptidyl-prolyl cis-trans isomerase SlpA